MADRRDLFQPVLPHLAQSQRANQRPNRLKYLHLVTISYNIFRNDLKTLTSDNKFIKEFCLRYYVFVYLNENNHHLCLIMFILSSTSASYSF